VKLHAQAHLIDQKYPNLGLDDFIIQKQLVKVALQSFDGKKTIDMVKEFQPNFPLDNADPELLNEEAIFQVALNLAAIRYEVWDWDIDYEGGIRATLLIYDDLKDFRESQYTLEDINFRSRGMFTNIPVTPGEKAIFQGQRESPPGSPPGSPSGSPSGSPPGSPSGSPPGSPPRPPSAKRGLFITLPKPSELPGSPKRGS
jgi:hypothetical protein